MGSPGELTPLRKTRMELGRAGERSRAQASQEPCSGLRERFRPYRSRAGPSVRAPEWALTEKRLASRLLVQRPAKNRGATRPCAPEPADQSPETARRWAPRAQPCSAPPLDGLSERHLLFASCGLACRGGAASVASERKQLDRTSRGKPEQIREQARPGSSTPPLLLVLGAIPDSLSESSRPPSPGPWELKPSASPLEIRVSRKLTLLRYQAREPSASSIALQAGAPADAPH